MSYPPWWNAGRFEQSHPTVDASAVTLTQRAQILREELAWFEEEWASGAFDTMKDVWVALNCRIEEIEQGAASE